MSSASLDRDNVVDPSMFTAPKAPTARGSRTPTDGLWNQAQAVFGTILRSRNIHNQPVRTIGLTSCYRQEGVSTVTAVLALAAACQRRVLLVDANLVSPSLHQRFRVQPQPGILQAVAGKMAIADCIQTSPLGISLLSAGCTERPADAFLHPERVLPVLESVTSKFDLVFVDLPAVHSDSSALELSGMLDGIVLVVEAERVHWQAGQRTVSRLRQSGAQLMGAVFNKRQDYIPDWLYRVL